MSTKPYERRVREYLRTHPGCSPARAQANLKIGGITREYIASVQKNLDGNSEGTESAKPSRSVKGLLSSLDDVGKVRRYMTDLPKSEYIEDDALRRTLGIAEPRWRSVRDQQALAGWKFILPNKRVVWLHPDAQQQLKRAIELA